MCDEGIARSTPKTVSKAPRAKATAAVRQGAQGGGYRAGMDRASSQVGGTHEFLAQEVLPCVRHLARLEKAAGGGPRDARYALFHEAALAAHGRWTEVTAFFDVLVAFETVAPPEALATRDPRVLAAERRSCPLALALPCPS